jgi:hypothetical protein
LVRISGFWRRGDAVGRIRLIKALAKTESQKLPIRMSALGQKRSFDPDWRDVRFAPKADVASGPKIATDSQFGETVLRLGKPLQVGATLVAWLN